MWANMNPLWFVDPFGLSVTAVFDLKNNTLTVTDTDTGVSITVDAGSGGDPYGDPIPLGVYEILERAGNESFRLDAIDEKPRNDIHDPSGRNLFRLHGSGLTIGCIECTNQEQWNELFQLISQTKTESIIVENYYPWWMFWKDKKEESKKYGELEVRLLK